MNPMTDLVPCALLGAAGTLLFLRQDPDRKALPLCILLALAGVCAGAYLLQIPRLPTLTRLLMTALAMP